MDHRGDVRQAAACPSARQLEAFQLGMLAEEALEQLADHLESCADCQALVRQWDDCVDPLIAALRQPAPVELAANSRMLSTASPTPTPGPSSTSLAPFAFLFPPAQPDEMGRFGNYRILRLIGEGGMGYVFHAEDIALKRPVALKIMKPERSCDAERLQRFIREARILARVKHENLVAIYQAGQEGGLLYLAMELLAGEALDTWLSRQRGLDVPTMLRLAREITTGLAVVHRHGLIHRDIKPANIWLEAPGQRVRILDFGLARAVDDDAHLTQEGVVIGTPAYMSPEQACGARVDVRSDLFSLGSVLYHLAAGTKPFQAENTMAALAALAVQVPVPLHERNPSLPRPLSDLVSQLLTKALEDRPASAEIVLERLRQIEADPTLPADVPPPTPALRSADSTIVVPAVARPARSRRSFWLTVGVAMGLGVIAVLGGQELASLWDDEGGLTAPEPKQSIPEVAWPQPPPGSVFLKDLEPVAKENWPFIPPGAATDGSDPVKVRGKVSPKGLHMHPPPPHLANRSAASLSYSLDRAYRSFHACIGLNDGPARSRAPITFSVYGDGQRLWQSRPVTRSADAQPVTVEVDGVKLLKIETTIPDREAPIGALAVWIEPHLVK